MQSKILKGGYRCDPWGPCTAEQAVPFPAWSHLSCPVLSRALVVSASFLPHFYQVTNFTRKHNFRVPPQHMPGSRATESSSSQNKGRMSLPLMDRFPLVSHGLRRGKSRAPVSLDLSAQSRTQWRTTLMESRQSARVHVAFAGSQDYRVWGRALCKDPISTFFPSATPKSLIVWPQTKYFETTPSQASFLSRTWMFHLGRNQWFGRDRSGCVQPFSGGGKENGIIWEFTPMRREDVFGFISSATEAAKYMAISTLSRH